jgi:hypothetical protein
MPTGRFTVDPHRVVHETIGEETILINLEAGTYHSLTGSGPDIWALLGAGCTSDEAVARLSDRYPEASDAELGEAVRELSAALVAADLLESDEHRAEPGGVTLPAGGTFVPYAFQSYSDMQYLLLLDPIHDVAPGGWPAPAEQLDEPAARGG